MTFNVRSAACAVVLVSIGATAGAAGEKPEPLTMKLSAYMSTAGNDVIVRARVEPDVRSRELTIEWVSDDLSGGSHAITLDGVRAAATHEYAIRQMLPGKYEVTGVLRLSDGTKIRRKVELSVVGIGGPDDLASPETSGAIRRPASQR